MSVSSGSSVVRIPAASSETLPDVFLCKMNSIVVRVNRSGIFLSPKSFLVTQVTCASCLTPSSQKNMMQQQRNLCLFRDGIIHCTEAIWRHGCSAETPKWTEESGKKANDQTRGTGESAGSLNRFRV